MRAAITLLLFCGRIFSLLYGFVMKVRALGYSSNLFRRTRVSVPVISVGNLTMGGTGKTPMVIYLANLFAGRRKTVVISRGYGGKATGKINIVSDEAKVFLSSIDAGDEPRLIADAVPGVPVLTGSRRAVTASYAVEEMAASLLIMDDGFQHMALERDVDMVLFSASTLLGNGWVCPGGPLREPFSALKRADLFVITGVCQENASSVDDFRDTLTRHFSKIPLFLGEYVVVGLSCVKGLGDDGKSDMERKFYAFCGIATPQSFLNSLMAEKITIGGTKYFRDHHLFTKEDLQRLESEAEVLGCKALVTTEKDWVKLSGFDFTLPVYVLQVRLKMPLEFEAYLLGLIEER